MVNNYILINIPIKINSPCHIKMIYITNNTSEDSVNSEHAHSLQGKLVLFAYTQYGPWCEKTCLQRFANNNGADQPAHPCSLISTFVIRLLQS